MTRILMIDLGETLVHNGAPFPHVHEALRALKQFKTAAGKRAAMSLVSDFGPPPPVPASKIAAVFREFNALLDRFGLAEFFKPPAKCITLSAHAGAFKPDRRVFEKAIERLKIDAGLADCLFITENAEHLAACRRLGMQTLQFGPPGSPGAEFNDWSDAPLLIRGLMDAPRSRNLELALGAKLAASRDLELLSLDQRDAASALPDRRLTGRANQWFPAPLSGEKIYVPLPVDLELTLDGQGRIESVKTGRPDPQALSEAALFIETLQANRRIASEDPPPPGTTHLLKTDRHGRKRLTRRGFN